MLATAERLGGTVLRRHRAAGVYRNREGAVVGVRASTDNGEAAIRAHKAVVFATGGFVHNEELAREHLGGLYPGGCAARTSEGDLIRIASALGVPLINMGSAWGAPVLLERALAREPGLIANFILPGDSIIEVNKHGVRVRNEKTTYNDRTQGHFAWDARHAEYSNWLIFPVWDRRCAQLFGAEPGIDGGNFIPPSREPASLSTAPRTRQPGIGTTVRAEGAANPWQYIVSGDTLEDLAAALDARLASLGSGARRVRLDTDFAARLRGTIERFNGYARAGRDPDFHRGETSIEAYFHGPRADDNDLPNEQLYPLSDRGPYYATILAPGAIDTKGGPKVNRRLQILDATGEPVPGLYGVGNCVASASGGAYWSGGSTYGPYVGFGYAAAHSAVTEPNHAI
jgi:succinate dehydrogenase/fumarate reductase flavoprotein subunit